jgi:hypothetical protein
MTVLTDQKSAESEASAAVLKKPRSGYARMRLRFHGLVEVYEHLQADYDRLRQDYAALEAAFSELKELNASLVDDLRPLRLRAGPPISHPMGVARTLIGGAR